jgi:hypothetical protein
MKYKFTPSKLLAILVLSIAVASQAWADEPVQSVDDATSLDPYAAIPAPQEKPRQPPPTPQPATEPQTTPPEAPGAKATMHNAPDSQGVEELQSAPKSHAGEEYGPPNYLKVWKNPFGSSSGPSPKESSGDDDNLITLKPSRSLTPAQMLSRRLISSKLYLPERILIGESSKFTVKGPPNWRVAIAMADKDEGAKPVNNHKLRLGADRKVVAVGKIPPTGVLELYVATPIQGDLIGTYLFFEAAIWSKDDLSDTQLAETVPPVISKNPHGNGVQIAALTEKKRGLRFLPDASIQTSPSPNSLTSGNP